ncbi:MAG: phosphonopyruvate decarboxylase [Chloroflexi bacterium]|nr:phosphonopyruvate decarboxylase [Chloroflexota bacterium]
MLSRLDALKVIAAEFPREPIVVTLGAIVRELLTLGRCDNHLYVLDSMGLPPAIGLGLSLGLAKSKFQKVVTIEGDGSLLMGLNTLATAGMLAPENYFLVVLDNGVYAATGGQRTSAPSIDFAGVAQACGMQGRTLSGESAAELAEALREARTVRAPQLLRVYIDTTNVKTPYFLEDPVGLGQSFQAYLRRER